MTQTPSSGGGATPTTGSPATGTPASPGATPGQATLTLEEALKRIAELEQHASNKTEEAARHGNRLTAAEKELAAYKAAEEAAKAAQMSELEKAQKLAADSQEQQELLAAELFESRVFQEVSRHIGKFNFTVSADIVSRLLLLDDDSIEFEAGKPTNVEKLLERLAKAEPNLVKAQPVPPTPGVRQAPATPAMNPGRTSINPGGTVPGRPPRLTDPGIWKK